MKIDMKKLKANLCDTAAECSTAKQTFKKAQREKTWTEVNVWRSECAYLSERMTKLCVFKAHLRGRTHLTANSFYADQVESWIRDLEVAYEIKSQTV